MNLGYTYTKIKKIAKEVRAKYQINSLVEIVQYAFSDEDVLTVFIREGSGCKTNAEADKLIDETMQGGTDYFEIQQEVIRGLISANFYKKELQEMLSNLTVSATAN